MDHLGGSNTIIRVKGLLTRVKREGHVAMESKITVMCLEWRKRT